MSLVNTFVKLVQSFTKKGEPEPQDEVKRAFKPQERPRDVSVLPEMAEIITNNNEQAIQDMTYLAHDIREFQGVHPKWYAEMEILETMAENELLLNIFTYWLTGYNATHDNSKNPLAFGAHLVRKEDSESIIEKLKQVAINLDYTLDLDSLEFSEDDKTATILNKIGRYLDGHDLTLFNVDTYRGSYNVFIAQNQDYNRLLQLASKIGFKIQREFR